MSAALFEEPLEGLEGLEEVDAVEVLKVADDETASAPGRLRTGTLATISPNSIRVEVTVSAEALA